MSPPVNELSDVDVTAMHDVRAVLKVRDFRRLYIALALSSLGDWLGLLATTALAAALVTSSSAQLYAISGVLLVRLVPALVLGPFAGAFADRFDRRWTMIISDVMRGMLFASVPVVHRLDFLIIATFLIETLSLFWIPAKEASVPNLLHARQLETANQLSLIVTYGSAVPAAILFTVLSSLNRALGAGIGFFHSNPVDLSLYFDAATFIIAAVTVFGLREISGRSPRHQRSAETPAAGILRSIGDGWLYVRRTALVRGLVVGILGAFAAGGMVIALSRPYVELLNAGDAAYGLLFGAVFLGLATGFVVGPRLLTNVSRRRLFGMAIVGAGVSLAIVAVVPNLGLALVMVLLCTTFGGTAWVTGYTLLGLEVPNEMRGRTFGFVQSMIQVILFFSLAAAPALAGAIGRHQIRLGQDAVVRADGVTIVLLVGGLLAVAVGVSAFRQMDDRPGLGIWTEVRASFGQAQPRRPGFFVAFEGGEGAGKSTQLRLLKTRLESEGFADVIVTHEPGGTDVGTQMRALLLDPAVRLGARAEALLYAADRAEHVAQVLGPALDRGAVVLSDRYVDSSLAYQGEGRAIDRTELERLQRIATGGLRADLTVVLDLPPAVGLERARSRSGRLDRIEAETLAFHERVRAAFLELANKRRGGYLVVDAEAERDRIAEQIATEVLARLRRRGVVAHKQDSSQQAMSA